MRRLWHKKSIVVVLGILTFWTVAITAQATDSNLLVLVHPESAETALIEELGYTPVYSMEELLAQFDPSTCVIAIGRSGFPLADWDRISDALDQSIALVGIGWEVEELLSPDLESPVSVPGLISVLYFSADDIVTYTMNSTEELDDFLDWACFLLGDMDAWPDDAFDFDAMDLELILEQILAEAEPFLAFLNHFLQAEWEYKVISLDDATFAADTTFERNLNVLGSDGWELVTSDGPRLILKRRALGAERLLELMLEFAQEMMESFDEQEMFFF